MCWLVAAQVFFSSIRPTRSTSTSTASPSVCVCQGLCWQWRGKYDEFYNMCEYLSKAHIATLYFICTHTGRVPPAMMMMMGRRVFVVFVEVVCWSVDKYLTALRACLPSGIDIYTTHRLSARRSTVDLYVLYNTYLNKVARAPRAA